MRLLLVSHQRQRRQAECLAACAAIALDYLNTLVDYERLVRLLRIGSAGAPFRNLRYLESLGLSVLIERGELETLESHLRLGTPPIVFVNTGHLSYWHEATGHALIVIGIEGDWIYLDDPAFDESPQVISVAEFRLAWFEMDQFYALIGLK